MEEDDWDEEADESNQDASMKGNIETKARKPRSVQNVELESQEELEEDSGEEEEDEEEWEEELEAGEKGGLEGREEELERGEEALGGRGKDVQEGKEESEDEPSDDEGGGGELDGAAEEVEGSAKGPEHTERDVEGGSNEEDEDTPLVFDADLPVDPLSLAEARDEPGHEFERYTKLQYEMLAERKRRAQEGG